MLSDLVIGLAHQDIDNVYSAETLPGSVNSGEYFSRDLSAIKYFGGRQTYVAVATTLLEFVAKVGK